MSSDFLEQQAKARGMTVSEMMKKRGELANKRKGALKREAKKRVARDGNKEA